MFPTLKSNYGTAAIIFPIMVLMGWGFGADTGETLYSAVLMYMTAIVLFMLDDLIVIDWPATPLLTESDLVDIDTKVQLKLINTVLHVQDTQLVQQD